MSDKGKYCCFNCPKDDFDQKAISSRCPSCGKRYDFPLLDMPDRIQNFKITESLGRGFYGATYIAKSGGLISNTRVLKIVPIALYEFFCKDFKEECETHARISENAEFLVGISDAFDDSVRFNDVAINCHVSVLEHLRGSLLIDYFNGQKEVTPSIAAQIACDLLMIKSELESNGINHNDFHAGNIIIEERSPNNRRAGVIEPSIKAVAIDMGSLSEDRRSGGQYSGDLHWIARHISTLADRLQPNKNQQDDHQARVALELKLIAQSISAPTENIRVPNAEDIRQRIEDAYYRTSEPWRPWREPLKLKNFKAHYNAQTIKAWHVPALLVDPDGYWLKKISSPGPLIITGMRGCGKTMLLRAMQFHARAFQAGEEIKSKTLDRLKTDGYVGLFVSASSLGNVSSDTQPELENLYARLVVSYALEASRALAHLNDIDESSLTINSTRQIVDTLNSILDNDAPVEATNVRELEVALIRVSIETIKTNSRIRLAVPPDEAFSQLAIAIKKSSRTWQESQVLFLFDDVSTRYLKKDLIDTLLSKLIFQNPSCAFKITSETQTIFFELKSPGGIEQAAHWRDFDTFDLGAEVSKRLKEKGRDRFLEQILEHRAKLLPSHPNIKPSEVLGTKYLKDISKQIAFSKETSADRKSVYAGFPALRAMCVGDMGSAITLYEDILNRSKGTFPIPDKIQHEVFQNFCTLHLYLLDRREGNLKAVAKSFSSASYKLMMQSAKKDEARGLREYASLYVRITAGDTAVQVKRLRELIDAGVFVYQGGAPRTKTRDSDPMLQFKLTYRKVYGLADYIGLAERDRFELSGTELEDWLNQPENGAEILMRNLDTGDELEKDFSEEPEGLLDETDTVPGDKKEGGYSTQDDLFSAPEKDESSDETNLISIILPAFTAINPKKVEKNSCTLVLALGFEERALKSAIASLDKLHPKSVILIQYGNAGRSDEIIKEVKNRSIPYEIVDSSISSSKIEGVLSDRMFIDITGLSKALIYRFILKSIERSSKVGIVYTETNEYSPSEADLKKVLNAETAQNFDALQQELKSVLTGEQGPYRIEELHCLETDKSRINALIAFGSAKHERLIHLIEHSNYEDILVVVDEEDSARAKVGRLASDVAVKSAQSGMIRECNIRDPSQVAKEVSDFYEATYISSGANLDIGLTGDKIEAVAVAAFCSQYPVNRVLYVTPDKFDESRFTKGTKKTHYFEISTENFSSKF